VPEIALSSGPPGGGARRADALKNRALLLEAASQLFARHGVESVSMYAIAEAAGVGKGTLYRHFENKAGVCEALLDAQMRDLQARTFARLAVAEPPADKLRWFLAEVVAFVAQNDLLLGSDMGVEMLTHPAHAWWRHTIHGLLRQIFAPLTRAAEYAGFDWDYLADALYVLVDARAIAYQLHNRGYTPARVVAALHGLLDRLLPQPT
jgi:AcrR family transcriptional regulator